MNYDKNIIRPCLSRLKKQRHYCILANKTTMMDRWDINSAIAYFTLNQRSITYQFKKTSGLNRTDIEILTFASTVTCFNPYEAQKQFLHMNLQQVRISIRKLAHKGAIEAVGVGKRGHAAVYMTTSKGLALLEEYNQYWSANFYPENLLSARL